MNGMRVATAAIRWHAAKEVRLDAGRRKKHAVDATKTSAAFCRAYDLLRAAEMDLAEAKRMERTALRALAKECAAIRKGLIATSDGVRMPQLPQPEIIDV